MGSSVLLEYLRLPGGESFRTDDSLLSAFFATSAPLRLTQLSQFEAKTSMSPWFAVRQRPGSSLHFRRLLLGIGLLDLTGRDLRPAMRRFSTMLK